MCFFFFNDTATTEIYTLSLHDALPICQHGRAKMMRMFYTEAYHVEVDKCHTCGLIWFDQDELEVLQYLIESSVEKV